VWAKVRQAAWILQQQCNNAITNGAALTMDAALVTKQHVQQFARGAANAAKPYLLHISLLLACEADVVHCSTSPGFSATARPVPGQCLPEPCQRL
jgi:hypothetical protein